MPPLTFDDVPDGDERKKKSGVQFDDVPSARGDTASSPGVLDAINRGVNWLGTRATKAATGFAGAPRAISDLNRAAQTSITGGYMPTDPLSLVGQFLPSTQTLNDIVFNRLGVPETNLPGKTGKVIDAGTEAALGAVAMPGSIVRNVLPAMAGGALQEAGGQATAGTPWEPFVRLSAGLVGGVGTALGQNALGSAARGVSNLVPNTQAAAGRIVGRAMERDQLTGNALTGRMGELGPGATIVEAGGPNIRGTMRGSIAAPGEARTTTQNVFDTRLEGSNARTTAVLDRTLGNNSSLGNTVEDISTARAAASGPAYARAGIPQDRSQLGQADRLMMTDDLLTLFKDSPDVQTALANARRVPELRNEPIHSMAVLDRVYKHIGGLEQQARQAGNNARAADLGDIRKRIAESIDSENAAYADARRAYSGPSQTIDAANRGREWFTKNVDPQVVRREFDAMSPGDQAAVRVGARDWARTMAGRSDRGIAAERVWSGGDNRERLRVILGDGGFAQFQRGIEPERNLIRTQRDISVGSRTAPMGLEASDNAGQTTAILGDIARGHPGNAFMRLLGDAFSRVTEGRTEAVNARIAQMLASSDPREVGLVTALMEEARRNEALRASGRFNALTAGPAAGLLPIAGAGERR